VVAEFTGPYRRLGEVHKACIDYIKKEELRHGGACWEVYIGPGDGCDAPVEVYYPIEP
jgi:effector-binding domain-containing protein